MQVTKIHCQFARDALRFQWEAPMVFNLKSPYSNVDYHVNYTITYKGYDIDNAFVVKDGA
jgi:hypothetical protein